MQALGFVLANLQTQVFRNEHRIQDAPFTAAM
jgi:hypothetical protein